MTPTFSWRADTEADYYQLWVNNITTGEEKVIYEESLNSTSFTPSASLSAGNYVVWVRGRTFEGMLTAWSAPREFSIQPAMPPIIGDLLSR